MLQACCMHSPADGQMMLLPAQQAQHQSGGHTLNNVLPELTHKHNAEQG